MYLDRFCVVSRSGLNASEKALIDRLPALGVPDRIVVLGNRSGMAGLMAHELFPQAAIHFNVLDAHHVTALRQTLERNGNPEQITVSCEPYLDAAGDADAVLLQISSGALTGELVADLLQQAHQKLKKGGVCIVSAEDPSAELAAELNKIFGSCMVEKKPVPGCAVRLTARKTNPLKKVRNFAATFDLTLPGQPWKLPLISLPGVFAHRRVDEGAQALAEIADVQEGDALLDMGCGCGSVGLALARKVPLSRLTLVDGHVRATYCTTRNAEANGFPQAEVLLSSDGLPAEYDGAFSLFVGNPPYFSNYRIAELFVQTAHRALRPGGRAYFVAKNPDWLLERLTAVFGNAELLRRRGYGVVRAVRV